MREVEVRIGICHSQKDFEFVVEWTDVESYDFVFDNQLTQCIDRTDFGRITRESRVDEISHFLLKVSNNQFIGVEQSELFVESWKVMFILSEIEHQPSSLFEGKLIDQRVDFFCFDSRDLNSVLVDNREGFDELSQLFGGVIFLFQMIRIEYY